MMSVCEGRPREAAAAAARRVLALVRHGESEGNAANTFTGWFDPGLTGYGREEMHAAGRRLRRLGHSFDHVFTSRLRRTIDSAALLVDALGCAPVAVHPAIELNERDYGQLAGLNKDEARRRWGDEQVRIWRRSYAVPPPGGESLRDVVARVAPYYLHSILPRVLRGEPVLVVAHGNVLRALTMIVEAVEPDTIQTIEYATGEIVIYRIGADAVFESRERDRAPVMAETEP
jgi:2,3-bisphosphoglycerate-dependent phosphoglycerate mutase